ncbi:MAG TPA: stage III sporulation protein AA [Firmicutes bacterium]|nr:stage III sporulation protein AA [Bacillota bacterium]
MEGAKEATVAGIREVLMYMAPCLRRTLEKMGEVLQELEEIRLRAGQPLQVETGLASTLVTPEGLFTDRKERALRVAEEDILRCLQLMGENSLYTLEEELKEGFITLPGGHRVGLAGECLAENGRLVRVKRVTALNLRIAREAIGSSRPVLPFLVAGERPLRVMIISPPQAGKTTLLRDIVRSFSNGEGVPAPVKVGLVDERGEIAGCFRGVPQLDVGIRTDVLSGCPKQDGILLLLRSMSPQVIATDEIGRPADLRVIEEVLNAGVGFIVTAHAWDTQDLSLRPVLREIWLQGLVEKVIILSRRYGSGTLEGIWDGKTKKALPVKPVRLGVEN